MNTAAHQEDAPASNASDTQRALYIATGKGHLGQFRQHRKTWSEIVALIRGQSAKVPATKEKYAKLSRAEKGELKKQLPWYIGGQYGEGGGRKRENLISRDLVNPDLDKLPLDVYTTVIDKMRALGIAFVHTSSASNEVNGLRSGRITAPLSRSATQKESVAISRLLSAKLGIEHVDPAGFRPNQICYGPSGCSDSEVVFEEHSGACVDADALLSELADWEDVTQWPYSEREKSASYNEGSKRGDPREISGLAGAFNRKFDVISAITEFELPFAATGNDWCWLPHGATGAPGAKIYGLPNEPDYPAYLYNNHQHGLRPGRSSCAHELVRAHKFGELDKDTPADTQVNQLPSTHAMNDWIRTTYPAIAADAERVEFEELGFKNLNEDPLLSPDPDVKRGSDGPGSIPQAERECSDLANANRLQRRFGKQLMMAAGEFYYWAGTHWAHDDIGVNRCIARLSKLVAPEAKAARAQADAAYKTWEDAITDAHEKLAQEHPRKEALKRMPEYKRYVVLDQRAKKLENWVEQCEMDYRQTAARNQLRTLVAVKPERLNSDQWLFNCLNGTLDLRTGKLRGHCQEDYITLCAPVRYIPDAQAPAFMEFITSIVGDDTDTAGFLQRWFGSCLTGDTTDQKWVVHHGPGGNGKTKLMRTLQHILGEYAGTAPVALLIDEGHGSSQHRNDVMTLWGKRMMTASEPDAGAKLRQAFVKAATGEERMVGRWLYKNNVEFDPTHKIQMLANQLPTVPTNERASWRRILVVFYPKKFGSAEDIAAGKAQYLEKPRILEKLKEESEGILAWMVRGALDWREKGLRPSAAVIQASRAYEAEEDRIGQFIKECCRLDPAARAEVTTGTEALFTRYTGWCRQNNYIPLGSGKFKKALLERPGIHEARWDVGKKGVDRTTKHGLSGMRLLSESFEDPIEEPEKPEPSKPEAAPQAAPAAARPAPASKPDPVIVTPSASASQPTASNGHDMDASALTGPLKVYTMKFPLAQERDARQVFVRNKCRWRHKGNRNGEAHFEVSLPEDKDRASAQYRKYKVEIDAQCAARTA